MTRTIILTEPWTMSSSGVTKKPGSQIDFSNRSDEAQKIIDQGKGVEKQSLPADMPSRAKFIAAGYESLQELATLSEWTQVKGIGPKTAKELDDYFQSKTKGE